MRARLCCTLFITCQRWLLVDRKGSICVLMMGLGKDRCVDGLNNQNLHAEI